MNDRWRPIPGPGAGQEWLTATEKRVSMLERRTSGRGGNRVTPLTVNRPAALSYNRNGPDDSWEAPAVTVRNGFAAVTGLVAMGTVTAGTIITTLPPFARPDTDMVFITDNSGVGRALYVHANGDIKLGTGYTVNGFVTLSNIIFPVVGRAQWIEVPTADFRNGWQDFSDTGNLQYGKVRYWKDEFGMTWSAGMVKNGTTPNNTTMYVIPASYGGAVAEEQHIATTAAETFGYFYPNSDGQIGYGAAPGAPNAWLSMAARWQTQESRTGLTWLNAGPGGDASIGSGWTNYLGNFPTLGIAQRADGMAVTKGLVNAGSLGAGTVLIYAFDSMRRKRTILLTVASNSALGRLDVQGYERAAGGYTVQGALSPAAGSNVWFSVDGKAWFPE